jgi:signal transduction histidine kinase
LNHAIEDVIALVQGELLKNGVSVQMRTAEGLFPVKGDRVQLQQVILNLILNSIEAMTSTDVSDRALEITTELSSTDFLLVAVADSGPGIATKDLDRIFESFYTTKRDGVGIGLSICRSIVEAHGGRLWAETSARGAVLRFTLPAHKLNADLVTPTIRSSDHRSR